MTDDASPCLAFLVSRAVLFWFFFSRRMSWSDQSLSGCSIDFTAVMPFLNKTEHDSALARASLALACERVFGRMH